MSDMNLVQQNIPGTYNYVDVVINNVDYAVINNGPTALSTLGFNGPCVFDLSKDYYHWDIIQAFVNSMDYCNIPGVVLCSIPGVFTDRVRYFPYYALVGIEAWRNHWQPDGRTQAPTYLYSCLNRRPHVHRIYNWYALKDVPEGLWSMYNYSSFLPVDELSFNAEAMDYWHKNRHYLPTDCVADLTDRHPAYYSSYVNLITESRMSGDTFISEKTWKPIANSQLFLVVGSAGTISHLRSLGVDVFDDVIDHSYDDDSDSDARLFKVQQSFKNLMSADIPSIWEYTKKRRLQNAHKFYNREFVISDIRKLQGIF